MEGTSGLSHRLPDEILAKIFSFCPVGTLYSVMLTCKRFRNCANINSVWKAKLHEVMHATKLVSETEDDNIHSINPNRFDNCKEIFHRFRLIFDSCLKYNSSTLKCARCGAMFCSADCINDQDEMITFDFGSKMTWFIYTGKTKALLSLHPTVEPASPPKGDNSSLRCNSGVSSFAYEDCHVCNRIVRRRSVNSSLQDAPTRMERNRAVPRPKQSSRTLSMNDQHCLGLSEGDGDDDNLLESSDGQGFPVPESLESQNSASTTVNSDKKTLMYKFLLHHLLNRSAVSTLQNIPFVICEPIGCDHRLKLELVETILCTFKAPGVCFVPKAVGAALFSGLETCLVIDSGANNTIVTPVADSLALNDCTQHLPIGGSHLTRQLMNCLSAKGIDSEVNELNADSSHVKRECYLAYDAHAESRKRIVPKEINIKGTKDGKPTYCNVKLSHELYQLAEDMYLHLQLPQLILKSLANLSDTLKKQLVSNIILTGGNCRLSGLDHRLTHDLQRLLPPDLGHYVRVINPRLMSGRSDAVIGASYVKNWHHAKWISRRDFVLFGPSVTDDDGSLSARFGQMKESDSSTNCQTNNACQEFSPVYY